MQPRNRFASVAAALLVGLVLCPSPTAEPLPAPKDEAAAPRAEEAVRLVVWNRHITDFRVTFDNRDPTERARRAVERILGAPDVDGKWSIERRLEELDGQSCYYFTVNDEYAFRMFAGDVDRDAGETLEQAAQEAEARLREVMEARIRHGNWLLVLRGCAVALVTTLVFIAGLVMEARMRRKVQARLDPFLSRARARSVVGGVNVWPFLGGLRQVITRFLNWAIVGILIYLWLWLVLQQFPYSEPWGEALGGFLVQTLSKLGWGILSSVPGLFVVLVIFALAHAFSRGVGSYFRGVERGEVSVSWLPAETARATRQLLALVTWVFALVVAYPYIPGSETAAFKGVTVFLGLMVSLGSAGFVNQVMSGLAVIYSGAYQRGDFVRIGDLEGRVRYLGLLATRLEKPGGEEVSIPNAVVTANTTTNFSRGGEGNSEVVATSVTIGYDVPWRQVHGMLQLAAQKTPQLASAPAPSVLQRALSDFYVEYQLCAHLARREGRSAALSRLHSEIQDAFNEHGVQIMSPHYESQPPEALVVPRAAWFTEPAAAAERRSADPVALPKQADLPVGTADS